MKKVIPCLSHAARRRGERARVDRLNGVHDHIFRFSDLLFGVFEVGLVHEHQLARVHAQPLAAEPDLRTALLGREVQHAVFCCKVRRDLRQKGGFSHPGIAADEHERAAHDAAAEHHVKLGNSAGNALVFFIRHVFERRRLGTPEEGSGFFGEGRGRGDRLLRKRIEFSAVGASSEPLGRGVSALCADKLCGCFGHGRFLIPSRALKVRSRRR